MRSPYEFFDTDWNAVANRTVAQIPESERSAFINWISDNPEILRVYEDTLGEGVVPLWSESSTRKQIHDQQLPEGF